MNRFTILGVAAVLILVFQNCTQDGKGLMDAIDQTSCGTLPCDQSASDLYLSITSGTTLGPVKYVDLTSGTTTFQVQGVCDVPGGGRTVIEWKFNDENSVLKRQRTAGCNSQGFTFDVNLADVSITPKFFKLEVALVAVDAFDNAIGSSRTVQLQVRAQGTSGPSGGGPTPTPTPKIDHLDVDKFLNPGEGLLSADGRNKLDYLANGNLVFTVDGNLEWESATSGTQPGLALMQSDGNFVIYNAANNAIFATNTDSVGSTLKIQNDNRLILYSSGGSIMWMNGTRWESLRQMPGRATDIAVGSTGIAWIIGQGAVNAEGDSSIWRFNGTDWIEAGGYASKIAVQNSDTAWVVNAAGAIFSWNGTGFQGRSGLALDIAASSTGAVWILGRDNQPYIWSNFSQSFARIGGIQANTISIGPSGFPWVVKADNTMWEYVNASGTWVQRPGAARTIGSGGGPDFYHVGFGNIPSTNDNQVYKWNAGSWTPLDTYGINIGAGLTGGVWVIKQTGEIFHR
ncbi:MAG: tectonin domain-containing protein [Bdellovibrionia bacterium]